MNRLGSESKPTCTRVPGSFNLARAILCWVVRTCTLVVVPTDFHLQWVILPGTVAIAKHQVWDCQGTSMTNPSESMSKPCTKPVPLPLHAMRFEIAFPKHVITSPSLPIAVISKRGFTHEAWLMQQRPSTASASSSFRPHPFLFTSPSPARATFKFSSCMPLYPGLSPLSRKKHPSPCSL